MDSLLINLLDIGESGKDFAFKKSDDKALDEQLASVIEGLRDYTVKLHLSQAGDIYIAQGNFVLQKDDQCSLCGEDMVENVESKIQEYLVVETSKHDGHAPHSGLNYETKQETYFLDSHEMDVFAFLREVIASALPAYPKCVNTVKCDETRNELQKTLDAKSMKGHPAFSVLEQLKKKQ